MGKRATPCPTVFFLRYSITGKNKAVYSTHL